MLTFYSPLIAAFEVYTGIGDFLQRSDISALADEILGDPPAESLSMALVLSVIAIGCQVLQAEFVVPQVGTRQSRQMFAESCARITPFLLGHNSLLKLQVCTHGYLDLANIFSQKDSLFAGAHNTG